MVSVCACVRVHYFDITEMILGIRVKTFPIPSVSTDGSAADRDERSATTTAAEALQLEQRQPTTRNYG